jgi:hypothetical protein
MPVKRIEIFGMFGGNYEIFELEGEGDPTEVASDAQLREHLLNRGMRDQQITQANREAKA